MEEKIYLIDTNIIVDLFRNIQKVKKKLLKLNSINISVIVYGELIYGIENSSQKEKHLNELNNFLKSCLIIPITKNTAKTYGKIKTALKKQGTPIPENDIWIAAQAIEQGAVLLSNDKHFDLIKDLQLEKAY